MRRRSRRGRRGDRDRGGVCHGGWCQWAVVVFCSIRDVADLVVVVYTVVRGIIGPYHLRDHIHLQYHSDGFGIVLIWHY